MSTVFEVRNNKLIEQMQQANIEALLITSPSNVYYLTDFYSDPHERFMAYYLHVSGERYLFVPLLDEQTAKEQTSGINVIGIADGVDAYQLFAKTITPATSLGIEKSFLSLLRYEHFMEALNKPSCTDIEHLLLALRSVKSKEEIAKVQHAVNVVEDVIKHAVSIVKLGMTEIELTAEIEYQMRKLGAEKPAFESIVLTGTRSALPHGKPGLTPLKAHEFLLIDIGVQVDGYCSDTTRTFILGEASEEQKRIYNTVLAANEAGIAASRAGVSLGSIDKAARDVIEQAGYGYAFTHRLGHGFGMEVHEQPSVSPNNEQIVKSGLLYTIEPGIYLPQVGGVRIEDDVYIDEAGNAQVLTSYPKHLITIG